MHGSHHQDETVMDPGDGFSFILGVLLIIIIFLICKGFYRMCCSPTIRPGRPRGDSQCAITHHFSTYFSSSQEYRNLMNKNVIPTDYFLVREYSKQIPSQHSNAHHTYTRAPPWHNFDRNIYKHRCCECECACGCFCASTCVRVFFVIRSREACDLTHIETRSNSITLFCIDCEYFLAR